MFEQLCQALTFTLSPDNATRANAEKALDEYSKDSSYGFALLQVTQNNNVDNACRLAAATSLKNYIKHVWREERELNLQEDMKRQLRVEVYNAMFTSSKQISKLLCDAICIVSKCEFPESWPELIDMIVTSIQNNVDNHEQLMSVLTTLDGLCGKYRYETKSVELWTELKLVIDKSANSLTELFRYYVEMIKNNPNKFNDCVEVLTKLISIYHSILTQELVEVFEDSMNIWMPGFHTLYELKNTNSSGDSNETPLDLLWDEMTMVVTVYAQRYEEEILQYMEKFMELIWTDLKIVIDNRKKTQFAKSGINFLATIASRPQYQSTFENTNVLQTFVTSIILPNMIFTEEDIERLEDEPVAFFKEDLDGFDKETIRGASANFLRVLCTRYEKQVVEIITPVITEQMQSYQNNPNANWKQMDAVCSIVLAICSKTETQKYGATTVSQFININDFCVQLIIPELTKQNVIPLVAADCLKFFVTFRNQLDANLIVQFFNGQLAIRFLNPQSQDAPILRLYAAHTIERLLSIPLIQKEKANMNDLFVEIVKFLISDLSLPMGIDNCYIVKCLYKCITYMDNHHLSQKCLEYTQVVSSVLEVALCKSAYVDALAVHYIFEIICWFIKKSYVLPAGSADQFYHSAVLPIIHGVFDSDNRDFVPYGLQMTCALIEQYGHEKDHNPSLQIPTGDFEKLYVKMLQSDIWQSSVNVPSFVLAIRSYIRWMPGFALNDNYVAAVKNLLNRFILSKMNDTHGFAFANELLKHADNVNGLTSSDILKPILQRLTTGKNSKFIRYVFVYWMRYIAIRGYLQFKEVLDNIQSGCADMAYQNILMIEAGNDYRYTINTNEKRSVILGIIRLFKDTLSTISGTPVVKMTVEHVEKLIILGVRLIETFYVVKNTASNENEDPTVMETADQFNKLANVQLPDGLEDDVDFRREFVNVVVAYVNASGVKPNVPDDVQNKLMSFNN